MTSLTEKLLDLLERPIVERDRRKAVWHVRDWVANAYLGATAEAGRALAAYASRQADGGCFTFGAGGRGAEVAAFVNGGLGNIFEMDDTHRIAILHPGDIVVAAALAVAERERASGVEFLDAVIRGYEVSIRIGMAAGMGHYRHFYSTATCGVFGATAAAAFLMKLDREQTLDALAQAGMQSAGLWQCRVEPGASKQVAAGRAAQSAVLAADFAACGLRGPREILEGPHGFFAATCTEPRLDEITADATGPWRIWDVSFKPWPGCRHLHPVMEVCLFAREQVSVDEIAKIRIVTNKTAREFCDRPTPSTTNDGMFSIQHAVAVTLLEGEPSLEHFTADFLGSAVVGALRDKVSISVDGLKTAEFPVRMPGELHITLKSGEVRSFTVTTAKGDPENPMTEAELVRKFDLLLDRAGIGAAQRQAIGVEIDGLVDAAGVFSLARSMGNRPSAPSAEYSLTSASAA